MADSSFSDWLEKNRATLRLAASYLAIIMVLSVLFSIVLYRTSWNELNRQNPLKEGSPFMMHYQVGDREVGEFFSQRVSEGKTDLLKRLVYINLLTLAGGGLLSYYLARRSLEPIEQAMAAQSRFVEDASHELRTPLTALRTQNEVALRKRKLSSGEAKSILESNLTEIIRLSALSEGLLNLARDSKPSNQVTAFQLDEAVADSINNVLTFASAKDIAIKDEIPKIKLKTDRNKLVQVITILLDNAIKYSESNKLIKIEALSKNQQISLKVIDQGTGIRSSDLPHIFERFYRADHSRSHQNEAGYGLGLSIAQKITEQLDGSITASSRVGHGSIFTVKLPL